MDLTITAITTDATEPVHAHLRNLPTGTVAIFAPRNTQPITLAKHVDDTWRGYAGDPNSTQRTPTAAAHAWHYTAMSAATFTLSALLGYIATEAICKRIRGRN